MRREELVNGQVSYLVIVASQLEQMAQYGQVLITTSGVMLTVIGGISAIPGAHITSLLTIIAIIALIISMVFGFLAYGDIINSFRSPVKYDDYKSGAAEEPAVPDDFKLAGSDALVVNATSFNWIRTFTLIQFSTMLAGTALFVVGLAVQAGV